MLPPKKIKQPQTLSEPRKDLSQNSLAAASPGGRLRRNGSGRKFDDELTAVTSFLRKQETPHLLRSLNRNVFRLLTVMSALSGGRVPAPEEVEFEMYEGEVADE
jgi:hypothetical protein